MRPGAGRRLPPPGWERERGERFERVIAEIDRVNAGDPNALEVDGVARPKELAHAEQMTAWVLHLDPAATDAQLLAARAHHLRRWSVPRGSYPEGRRGYLRWRTALRRQQAEETGTLLQRAGYGEDTVEAVGRIMRKEGLGSDPEVQTHEDALCIVFVELQLAELAEKLDHDHLVEVVRKTLAKMSDAAIREVLALDLEPAEREIIESAAGS